MRLSLLYDARSKICCFYIDTVWLGFEMEYDRLLSQSCLDCLTNSQLDRLENEVAFQCSIQGTVSWYFYVLNYLWVCPS